MAETRRHSTRNRGEPPMKLRKSPELVTSSPPTTGRKPGRPRKSEAKDTPSKALKAISKAKAKDSPKPATPVPEIQDVAAEPTEDMSTLIEKSRQRWLNEGGIFEKFWTRPPRKRKGVPPSDLPTKAQVNMQEVGPARLIIDPHVFDIHIFGVKKPALTWQTPIEAPNASANQSITPAQAAAPVPIPAATSAPRPIPVNPYVRSPAGTPQTTAAQPANPRGLAPNPYAMPNAQPQNAQSTPARPQQSSPPASANASGPVATPGNAPAPSPASTPARSAPPSGGPQQQQQQPQQSGSPHPDPVIQMLAQRAAGDPHLKELMKVVAAGSESPEKLAEFQRHINEITEIVKQQQARAQKLSPGQTQTQFQQVATPKQQNRATPSIQSKPPAPVRVDYSQLAFDFVRGGDCYLFPQRSIIQHLPDGATTIISFLFTCKGKDVPAVPGGSRLKPEVDYYQPITITLLTVKAEIRTALTQVVGKPEQVVKEMEEIMGKFTLAPDAAVMLAAASARSKGVKRDSDGNEKTADGTSASLADDYTIEEDDVFRTTWDAPDSLLPF